MDAQKIQAQLSELQEKLKLIALQLNILDQTRLTAAEQLLKKSEIETVVIFHSGGLSVATAEATFQVVR